MKEYLIHGNLRELPGELIRTFSILQCDRFIQHRKQLFCNGESQITAVPVCIHIIQGLHTFTCQEQNDQETSIG